MKIELTAAKLLSPAEMSELAARLVAIHERTLATIERLNEEIDTQKRRIGERWKGVSALNPADRQRVIAQQETAAITEIRQGAKAELDGLLRQAGASHAALMAQRPYYQSKATFLARQGLGTARRTALEETAERTRQVGLAALAQLAIGTGDLVLAGVVMTENGRRRESERGFSTAEFLALVPLDEFEKARGYLDVGDHRMTAIALAIRTWQSARPAPFGTIGLALDRLGEDGAIVEELAAIAAEDDLFDPLPRPRDVSTPNQTA